MRSCFVRHLLCVVEVCCIRLVFQLSWLHVVLQSAEVVLAVLGLCVGLESLVEGRLLALVVLAVDCGASRLCKRLAEEVFRFYLRHVPSVPWHVLRLQILSWAAEPVLSLLRNVTIGNGGASLIDGGGLGVVFAGGVGRLANSHVDVVVAWLLTGAHDDAVDVAGGAAVDFVLLGCVARVTRQVLLAIVYLVSHD